MIFFISGGSGQTCSIVADFQANTSCLSDSAYFQDLSVDSFGVIVSWKWYFGDGDSSSLQNPAHLYTVDGILPITLIVESSIGCKDTVVLQQGVHLKPNASFSHVDTCFSGHSIDFLNTTTPSGNLFFWDFDDGFVSALENPVHSFSSDGEYQVKLIAIHPVNSSCTDSTIEEVTIYSEPSVEFITDAACSADTVQFWSSTLVQTGFANTWSWDLGNGEFSSLENPKTTYPSEGDYLVQLIVSTSGGCVDSISDSITVHHRPVGDFSFENGCVDSLLVFQDSSYSVLDTVDSWLWQMGDGATYTTPKVFHSYNTPGNYEVTLIAFDPTGCGDTVKKEVSIFGVPVSQFDYELGCSGEVDFDDLSFSFSDSLVDWQWDFGDGSISNDTNPTHVYTDTGVFLVQLQVASAAGCINSLSQNIQVINQVPVASFNMSAKRALPGEGIEFENTSSMFSTAYWDYGDGNTSTSVSPIYSFSDTGIFSVLLVVTNDIGCSDSVREEILIYLPAYVAGFFSPNGDGKNDEFTIQGGPFDAFDLKIYNRYGLVIFESTSPHEGWGGTYNGKDQPAGTYVYTLKVLTKDGRWVEDFGDINLLR